MDTLQKNMFNVVILVMTNMNSAQYPFNPPLTSYDYNNIRDRVFAFEEKMLEQPQLDLKVIHHFSYGIYGREMFIPKDTILVGKIHKYENMSVISQGEVTFLNGEEMIRVKAPYTFVAPAGTKRVIYAHKDTVWTVFHSTHEKDVDKIEKIFIAQNEQEWLQHCKKLNGTDYKEICGQLDLIKNTDLKE